jgi:hypothetical protein
LEACNPTPGLSQSKGGGAAETSHVALYQALVPHSSELDTPKMHCDIFAPATFTSVDTAFTENSMEYFPEQNTTSALTRHQVLFHNIECNTRYAAKTADWSDGSAHETSSVGTMSLKDRVTEAPGPVGHHGSSHRSISHPKFLSGHPGFQGSNSTPGLTRCKNNSHSSASDWSASKTYARLPTLEPRVDLLRLVEKGWPFLPEPLFCKST